MWGGEEVGKKRIIHDILVFGLERHICRIKDFHLEDDEPFPM